MAFSEEKNEIIRQELLAEARRCALTLGMRKTSVEQLTEAAGISKGSFYKFFDSKELLFFAVLEDFHQEVFAVAETALRENRALPRPAGQRRPSSPPAASSPPPGPCASWRATPSTCCAACRRT